MQRFVVHDVPEWPEWLTYSMATNYSGLSRTWLWELVSDGEISAAKVGRAVRIERASLQDYMVRHSTSVA
jgi:excisionase family DNA binding protein